MSIHKFAFLAPLLSGKPFNRLLFRSRNPIPQLPFLGFYPCNPPVHALFRRRARTVSLLQAEPDGDPFSVSVETILGTPS
jgi:hypothetical protein